MINRIGFECRPFILVEDPLYEPVSTRPNLLDVHPYRAEAGDCNRVIARMGNREAQIRTFNYYGAIRCYPQRHLPRWHAQSLRQERSRRPAA